MNFVNRLLAGNPQLRNNPMAHNALSAIQNGDDATGEQIAGLTGCCNMAA
jgi:hypothetical protein